MIDPALVLNELSITRDDNLIDEAALDGFSALLAEVRVVAPETYLVSPVRLWGTGINAQATFGSWASEPRNRDKLRQIVAMQNRAPIEEHFGVLSEGDIEEEYRFSGTECIGLGYASKLGLLAVSALTRSEFDAAWLILERLSLVPEEPELVTEEVRVRHAAHALHLAEHRDWLIPTGAPPDGSSLWRDRETLFDRLEFIDRVENQLVRLEGKVLASVIERLNELQVAAAAWNTADSPTPAWLSRVTPESSSRINKGLCDFADSSGETSTYSMHARYTPTSGRIHFRVDRTRGRLIVGYVGPKLL